MRKWMEHYNLPTVRRALRLMGSKRSLFITFLLLFCGVEFAWTLLDTAGIRGVINALTQHSPALFWQSMPLVVVSKVLWWVYSPIAAYGTSKITTAAVCEYRTNLLEHILKLPMRFFDGTHKGELLSVFTNDMGCLEGAYDWSFFQVLHSVTGGIGGVIVMAALDWRFALVVLALGSLSVMISARFAKQLEAIGKEQQDRLAQTSADAYELVKAAKTIRLYQLESEKERQFARRTVQEADVKASAGGVTARMNAAITAINALCYLAILSAGTLFVYFNLTDWGTVVALMGLKGTADMLFVEAGQFMAGLQGNIAGIQRLFAVQDEAPEVLATLNNLHTQDEAALWLDGISFAYDTGTPVLDGFSMKLKRNALTVLVGESGSGKSTVMKLILGLYPADSGNMTFSGAQYATLRGHSAYVPQDAMLFRGTVQENIASGKEDATREEVIAAAKMAGAHAFLTAMKNGYETLLLDDGKSLSGGQKQRIAIARALVKDAPILLLDEVTSALDAENERQILQTIQELSRTKAVLLITHKQDIQQWADVVYTMERSFPRPGQNKEGWINS